MHVHATTCNHDANTMQTRCKHDASPPCSDIPSMQARMQARAHAHASPMQARASTCSHMQVRDCNTNSHATHIICNLHTQQTHTILTLQLSLATLTCNSHMQHNMACSRRTSACTDYFSGLHVQLRCKAHAAISRQCKHACTAVDYMDGD